MQAHSEPSTDGGISGIDAAARTDVGRVRSRNEDAILRYPAAGLWAVADGLGGHAAGDVASTRVVECLARVDAALPVAETIAAINQALQTINAELQQLARARRVDLIGTTVALALVRNGCCHYGWVGDSRVYHLDAGGLHPLSRDHAYPAGPLGGGALTRAIGADQPLEVDWQSVRLRPGEQLLLCSDGVNKEMADEELAAALCKAGSAQAAIDAIVDLCLARGARDNVSAIVLRMPG